ncbi:putative zinc ribbon protein [Paenilisteria weihenstephanensis]|uniref:putative zinc ribbon protein n=1 Tax=Listeria weihenstephanensis TaxID=1006155 RepID=UPI00098D5759
MYCPNCGTKLSGEKFCPSCGTNIVYPASTQSKLEGFGKDLQGIGCGCMSLIFLIILMVFLFNACTS